MTRLFCAITTLMLVISCKQENNKTETNLEQNTTNQTIKPVIVPKEVSFSDLKTKFANQKNDTTYVYNFFATWCGPCMKEIPHFKEKIEETKNQPIKFVFISIDEKATWDTDLQNFANEHELGKFILKYDYSSGPEDFATQITKTWDGGSIPFTFIRKGEKSVELIGGISKEELSGKILEVQ